MTDDVLIEPDATLSEPTGFVSQICAYFRDFLETDFKRQAAPKRHISLKDAKGTRSMLLRGYFASYHALA